MASLDYRTPEPGQRSRSLTGLHDVQKRKTLARAQHSNKLGDRFIANRKNSRLDLDFKSPDGPGSATFVRGCIQHSGTNCSEEAPCFEGNNACHGVSPIGTAYQVVSASMLLDLDVETHELCNNISASREDVSPICHKFAPRVLRFDVNDSSPATVMRAPGLEQNSRPAWLQQRRFDSQIAPAVNNKAPSADEIAATRFLCQQHAKERHMSQRPTRRLDAPGLADDFYLSLLDWSPATASGESFLAVVMNNTLYIQSQTTSKIDSIEFGGLSRPASPVAVDLFSGPAPRSAASTPTELMQSRGSCNDSSGCSDSDDEGTGVGPGDRGRDESASRSPRAPQPHHAVSMTGDYRYLQDEMTAVAWSKQHAHHLAVGHNSGLLQIWDCHTKKVVHTTSPKFSYHDRGLRNSRISTIACARSNPNLLLFGQDSSFYQVDLRCRPPRGRYHQGVVQSYPGYAGEVCGLALAPDETHIASGSNENVVAIWDVRRRRSTDGTHAPAASPLCLYKDHTAAVKAIAWSPHKRGILATGGGTADQTIKVRNTLVEGQQALEHTIDTGAQVCRLLWSPSTNEFVSSHGFCTNEVAVWRYADFKKIASMTDNQQRVVHMAMSPDGRDIIVGANEQLHFYSLFPASSPTTWASSDGEKNNGSSSSPVAEPSAHSPVRESAGGLEKTFSWKNSVAMEDFMRTKLFLR